MKTFSTIQTDEFKCTAQDEAMAILLHYKRNDSRLDSIAGGDRLDAVQSTADRLRRHVYV